MDKRSNEGQRVGRGRCGKAGRVGRITGGRLARLKPPNRCPVKTHVPGLAGNVIPIPLRGGKGCGVIRSNRKAGNGLGNGSGGCDVANLRAFRLFGEAQISRF